MFASVSLTTCNPIWIADFVRRGAVLSEQELKHEDGDVRADLDLPDEILSNDLSGEQLVRLVVECYRLVFR